MNIKRVFLVMAAVLLMPGLAMAGLSSGSGSFDFQVNIEFTESTSDTTDVSIVCDNVEAPNDDFEDNLGDGKQAQFSFDTQTLETANCVVTASAVSGWSVSYAASGDGGLFDSDSIPSEADCRFTAPRFDPGTGPNVCDVTYKPAAESFTLFKDWEVSGTGGIDEDVNYTLKIVCAADTIVGGTTGASLSACEGLFAGDCDFDTSAKSGTSNTSLSVQVIPPTQCRGFELDIDNSSISSSGCSSLVSVGVDDSESCTITNTSFFEGIPTLNQYGLAILALLMLGVGFVGFRRFV